MTQTLDIHASEGEMARRIRDFDWAATPLGPMVDWPHALQDAVTMILQHPFPHALGWGPELITLYNDAYRPLLGTEVEALGRPFLAVWTQWHEGAPPQIGPVLAGDRIRLEDVQAARSSGATAEPAFFDHSISPLRDDTGAVAGLMDTAVETTAKVRAERALRAREGRAQFLLRLADTLRLETDPLRMKEVVCQLLGEHLGADRAVFHEVEGDHLLIENGDARDVLSFGEPYPADLLGAGPVVVPDVAKMHRPAEAARLAEREIGAYVAVPLIRDGAIVGGMVVHASMPRDWTDEDAALVAEVAQRAWSAVEEARAAAALRMSEARHRTLFQSVDAGVCLLERLPNRADRLRDYRYLAMNPAMQRMFGVHDLSGQSLRDNFPAEAEAWYDDFDRVLDSGEAIRVERESEPQGMVLSVFASPVEDGGNRVLLVVIQDVTTQRRAEADLQKSESRQRLLLALSDAVQPLVDPVEIQQAVCQVVGRHLGVSSVQYSELDFDRGVIFNVRDCYRSDMPSHVGEYPMEVFPAHLEAWTAGRTLAIDDVATTDALMPGERDVLLAEAVRATLSVPIVQDGRAVAVIAVLDTTPRRWTEEDRALLTEAAGRTVDAVRRARTEAALRESEERFRLFGENSADTLWIADAVTGQMKYLSPAFETMWGESRARVMADIGRWAELLHPEDREKAASVFGRVARGEVLAGSYRIIRPSDGAVRHIQDTVFPIADRRGRTILVGGVAQDVTDRRCAEATLRESEERLRSAVEVGKLGLWDWNIATGEIHWSDEHFRMEGYAVGEVTPSYEAWAARLHPEDRETTEAALLRARDTGEDYEHEFRVLRPDGSVRWLHGRGRFYYGEDGTPLRMVGAMADTTDRREMEEHQNLLIAELQHRTMNLIAVVQSLSENTARGSTGLADFRARFGVRLQALARAQRLLSRLDRNERVSFDQLLDAELGAVNADRARVTLTGPSGVLLRSSAVQTLALALHELATNAVKYGALGQPSGHLDITWTFEPAGADGEPWLHIEWRETGVAMPRDAAEPRGSGQGRELIERALPYQLEARTHFDMRPDGVTCRISLPASKRMKGVR